MFIRYHQDARASLEDFRRLHRMHQAFDGAIDHKASLLQRRDDRREPPDRLAGAGGADRHDLPVTRRRHNDMKRPRAHPQQCELGEVDVERARLGLREYSRGVARFDRAALENLAKRVDPFCLDAIGQHALSPVFTTSSCPGLTRASTSLQPSREDVDGRA
jgi:hypothetical protein